MSIEALIYPETHRPQRLMDELAAFFSRFPFVVQVLGFGSLARGQWDRWSDIDMIVITDSGMLDYWRLFTNLCLYKPVLHHGCFVPHVEPSGGYILGIVFADESVFHCLDLNFFSTVEASMPDAFLRFGQTSLLYQRGDRAGEIDLPENNAVQTLPIIAEHLIERQIAFAIHRTKKVAKQVLRGQAMDQELRTAAERLQTVLRTYPADITVPGGDIYSLSTTYVQVAGHLLQRTGRS